MTRWARAGNTQKHKRMPGEGSSWEELSKNVPKKTVNKVTPGHSNKLSKKTFSLKKKSAQTVNKNSNLETLPHLELAKQESNGQPKSSKKMIFSLDTLSSEDFKTPSKSKFKKKEIKNQFLKDNDLSNNKEDICGERINSDLDDFLHLNSISSECSINNGKGDEEIKHRKSKKKHCFNCRRTGHTLMDCPLSKKDLKQVTGVCFKCGSTEHTSRKCKTKIQGFPLAKCFICKEQGHISKDCSKNPHGVYIKGGSCKICGNVNHFMKDCPTKLKLQEEEILTLPMITKDTRGDAEIEDTMPHVKENKRTVKKVIKF